MNPGKTIWVTEWRMIRTGLGDPFGPKCCIEEEDMSIKVLGACQGVKIEDSLTKEPFFCPTVRGSSPAGRTYGEKS